LAAGGMKKAQTIRSESAGQENQYWMTGG